jgi:superfamily II DNA or RNA helicase
MSPTSNNVAAASPLFKFLTEFKPNKLYSMVDVRTITGGLKMFESGPITRFNWAEGGEILDVVFGRLQRPHQVCMALEGKRFLVTCSCGQSNTCQHVVASLMSIARILRGAQFSSKPFRPGYWEDLERQLKQVANQEPPLQTSKGAKQAGATAIVIACDQDGKLQLRTRFPGSPLSQIGVPEELATVLFDPDDDSVSESDLREWWQIAATSDEYILEVAMDGSSEKVAKAEIPPVLPFVELDGSGATMKAVCGVRFSETMEIRRLMRLGQNLVFLPESNELVWATNPAVWNFVENLSGPWRIETQTSMGRTCFRERVHLIFTPWNFNEAMVHFSEKELAQIFPTQLRCIPSPNSDAQPSKIEVESEVALTDEEDGGMSFQINVRTPAGHDLPGTKQVVQDIEEIVSGLGESFNEDPDRFNLAMSIIWKCLITDDPIGVVNACKEDPLLSNSMHYQNLRTAALETRGSIKSRGGQFLQLTGETPDEPWSLIENYYEICSKPVAIIGAVLESQGNWNFWRQLSLFELNNEWCEPGLILDIASNCRANNIRFTHNGREVEAATLDITVSMEPDEVTIDWFELHPTVICNGFEIPADRWIELIEGRLLPSEDEAGSMLIISETDAIKLKRMHTFYERAKGQQVGQKCPDEREPIVPRMQILDWIALENSGIRLEVPPKDREVLDNLRNFESMPKSVMAEGILADLRPYQEAGYSWLAFLYEHRFGAVLADDMGLGKTIQAIALMAAIAEGKVERKNPDITTHLIVLPPTLVFNWTAEIAKFFPRLRVYEYVGSTRDRDVIPTADVVLTTYELIRRDISALEKIPFDVVIFDEAQAVKNYTGARSKAVRKLNAQFRLILTGTPMENHIGEYFSVVELALPGLLGDRKTFIRESKTNPNSIQLQRARPFVLRRTKEKILKELPSKVQSDVYLDLGKTQKEIYTRTVAEVRAEVAEAFKEKPKQQASIVALSALTRLRQVCISPAILDPDYAERSPKLEHLATSLAELQREGNAALIFSQFTTVLDLIEATLVTDKIKYQRLDGSTPRESRQKLVEDFQSGEGPGIFLISLKAGGAGLNLTRASYVFHLDPWWNPAVENQATDRAHRMGQKQTVFVNRLLMRHTIEEKMMELKQRKQDLYNEIMEGAESRADRPQSSLITRDDMDFLLTV